MANGSMGIPCKCDQIIFGVVFFLLCIVNYWGGHQPSPTVVSLTHSHTMTPFDAPGKQAFLKHWEKEKLLAISPFPTVFSTRLDNFLPFSSNLKLSSANSFSLEESKICRLVMV